MKPLKLHLANIGPFVGNHSIDFTSLDNIYVITGKTGSGKTTVLDCITYALYGRLPGSRSNPDRRRLQSDFCSLNELSTLTLDFSINTKLFRVERTLPFSKISKKGTQTQADETAVLYSIEDAQKDHQQDLFAQEMGFTVLESQKSKVDEKIEDLLLLSIDEFTRIVLLPQGEFATFLKQNSKEKKSLLLKLFPIELFTKIIDKIKDEKIEKKAYFESLDLQVEHIKNSFNPDTAEEEKIASEKELSESNIQLESIQKTINKLIIEQQKLSELEKKYSSFKSITLQRAQLSEQKPAMEQLEMQIKCSTEAEKILPLIQNYTTFAQQLEAVTTDQFECKKMLNQKHKEKENLDNNSKKQQALRIRLSEIDVIIHDLERAAILQNSIEKLEKERTTLVSDLVKYQKELEGLHAHASSITSIIKNENTILEEHERALHEKKICAHKILLCDEASLSLLEKESKKAFDSAKMLFEDLMKQDHIQKLTNTASSLAEHLIEGEPCPVCGSFDHPNPVQKSESILNIGQKISLQEIVVRQTEDTLQRMRTEKNILTGSIAESSKSLSGLEIDFPSLSTHEEYLERKKENEKILQDIHMRISDTEQNIQSLKIAKEKVESNNTLIKALQATETSLQLEDAKIAAKIDEQQTEFCTIMQKVNTTSSSAIEAIHTIELEKANISAECDLFEKQKKEYDEQVLRLTEKISHNEKSIQEYTVNKEHTLSDLIENMKSSNMFECNSEDVSSNIEVIKKAVMDLGEKQASENVLETYKSETVKIEALYENLKEELSGTEADTQKQIRVIEDKILTYTKEQESLHFIISNAQKRITEFEMLLVEYTSANEKLIESKKSYELYERLHNVISGGSLNPKKIPLDSWILGMYLQEITIYANSRLTRMSNGRYELHLKQDAEGGNAHKGLDLEIYDEYTGKSRPTASLSGGETFMTAISLALAISDIVQEQNGGVQLDSLFIDEGFGSLDAESLEKALSILDEIRETRSIGLISHVESLQTRITSQIRVHKHAGGSTVEIHNSL